ncbi:MAG: Crp/Fnr family transcriptional regulator [Agriterribacter sp.]
MTQHPLISVIKSYTDFPDNEAACFLSFFEERQYKRNATLLEEGNVAHEVFFIIKGVLRQYIITEEGHERTCNFAFENEFLTDLESFSRQSRAASSIVALEHTTCLVVTCVNVVQLINNSPAAAEFFRIVVENVATGNIRRIKSLLSLSPEKQFGELLQNKPEILQRVPQRYIAQFLGIAPESLSRIRKRLMEHQKS